MSLHRVHWGRWRAPAPLSSGVARRLGERPGWHVERITARDWRAGAIFLIHPILFLPAVLCVCMALQWWRVAENQSLLAALDSRSREAQAVIVETAEIHLKGGGHLTRMVYAFQPSEGVVRRGTITERGGTVISRQQFGVPGFPSGAGVDTELSVRFDPSNSETHVPEWYGPAEIARERSEWAADRWVWFLVTGFFLLIVVLNYAVTVLWGSPRPVPPAHPAARAHRE